VEHCLTFFDRDEAESLLSLSWSQFLRRYPRLRSTIEDLIEFAFDESEWEIPSEEEIQAILKDRTIRWTIRHSSPQYHFLGEILYTNRRSSRYGRISITFGRCRHAASNSICLAGVGTELASSPLAATNARLRAFWQALCTSLSGLQIQRRLGTRPDGVEAAQAQCFSALELILLGGRGRPPGEVER
jgi:hypothetical protein